MTEQLLDFTRARIAGGITLNRRDTDIEGLIRHMLDDEEMANPAWTFEQKYGGNGHGRWDPDRLAQAFFHSGPAQAVAKAIGKNQRIGLDGQPIQVAFELRGSGFPHRQ